jgi:membrane protein implicated in regulation of membrane protease activity
VKFWLIVGLCLSIVEIFSGFFIALSFGVGAFLMAGLLAAWPNLLTEWYQVVFVYCAISLLVASLAWRKFKKNQLDTTDVND